MTGAVSAPPRDVALRILAGLFGSAAGGPSGPGAQNASGGAGRTRAASGVSLVEFQAEGAARVRAVLQRRGGAVLADSVGLGKTYVGLALIEETLAAGGDAVVVAPAALRGLWRRALRRLGRGGGAGGCRLVSHTQLARGAAVRAPPRPGPEAGRETAHRLVVVDEAHRFRNPRTLRYTALARLIAPGTRVLLMTATPVNNRPEDLLHLIRLFAADDAFRDVGVPSLRDAFGATEAGEAAGAEGEASRVTAVVRAVVVRRTRTMVRERFGDAVGARGDGRPGFPERAPPRVVRYEDPALPRLVAGVAGLELAPYAPHHSGSAATAPSAAGASSLIRLALLKRLDSSPAALETSLARLGRILHASLDAARAGRILTPGQGSSGGRAGDDDPLQLALIELLARPAPPDLDLEALARSIERDLARVREMEEVRRGGRPRAAPGVCNPGPSAEGTPGTAAAADPKLAALHDLLERTRREKMLVFTEYRDTAAALWRGLRGRVRIGRVDGSGAWLGHRPAGRRAVVERFAPRANGRRAPPDRERVDVLIATDVLSEGLNLQDARHVVSYDLPWNPVRLLQRIGRIDRLGSPHQEVVPWLFAPDRGLEALLGLTRRIRTKLGHIATTVGTERADELLERLARHSSSAPKPGGSPGSARRATPTPPTGHLAHAELDRVLAGIEAAREDPVEALRTLWVRNRDALRPHADRPLGAGRRSGDQGHPGTGPGGRAGPGEGAEPRFPQARLAVAHGDAAAGIAWLVLVARAGEPPALLEIDPNGRVQEAAMRAVAAVKRALLTAAALEVEPPARRMPAALPLRDIQKYMARQDAWSGAPIRLSRHDPGLRLARRIRRTMARAGAALDPRVVARADALLARIATPLDAAAEARVRALADASGNPGIEPLLDATEMAVGEPITGVGRETGRPREIAILAALRIHASHTPPAG